MIKFIISFIVIGMLCFYSMATFNVEYWDRLYFFWDKGKDVLLTYALWQLSIKKYGDIVEPLFWLTEIRFGWDIVSWLTGLSVNNPQVIGILFIIYTIYVFLKAVSNVRD